MWEPRAQEMGTSVLGPPRCPHPVLPLPDKALHSDLRAAPNSHTGASFLCWGLAEGMCSKKRSPQDRPPVPYAESTEGKGPCGSSAQGGLTGERCLQSGQSPASSPQPTGPQPIPMTVRWVLAVMLVTTLVAMHSHSPWSSLLRARNWRLPLGRALCLLLLGFPTLAKQGGGEEGGSRWQGTNQVR